jgi:hypothetical protein
MGVALFIVSYIVVYILSIGLALLIYSGLFTNFLSVFNLIYFAAGELVSPDWDFFFLGTRHQIFCGTQKNYALQTQSVATVFIPLTEE